MAGLQVFGTITKTKVATGADLVGYSGFSASNYLQQPYNADLDFGTGDFCVMGWFNLNAAVSGADMIFCRRATDTTGFSFYLTSSNIGLQFNTSYVEKFGTSHPQGVWTHVVGVRRNGVAEIYRNGVSLGTGSANVDISQTTPLVIGNDQNPANPFSSGYLALLRISATAPTPEQIAKIYRDEAPLFQEGAQATLYGDSDAVTALAYDDTTELLHVGTSAGRSVFQGLRRVDNTTDAVGAAISASNGLVAED